jgi:FHS family L-fucose permease-like MFS transporter
MADAQATQLPYLIVAIVLAVLAVAIARAKLPELGASTRRASAEARKGLSLFSHRNLIFGCGAIALCVLSEIGVGNLFINFASQPSVANITHENAAFYLTFVWGGMMVGRFAGAWIMRYIAPEKVLALFAVLSFAGALVAVFVPGPTAMYGLIAVGLGNSIMFPTIFALAIRGLGPLTEEGSGLLIMAIAGGALVFVQGSIADNYGLHWAFTVTALCSLYVLAYALWLSKPTHALAPEQLQLAGE